MCPLFELKIPLTVEIPMCPLFRITRDSRPDPSVSFIRVKDSTDSRDPNVSFIQNYKGHDPNVSFIRVKDSTDSRNPNVSFIQNYKGQ